MKKLILTAGILTLCLSAFSKEEKGTYNGMEIRNNKIYIKCKKSNYTCVIITRVDEGDPTSQMIAQTFTPEGELINEYAISDYSEEEIDGIDTEIGLVLQE